MLDGQDIYDPRIDIVAVRRLVGMVFQKPNPFPTMSIYDNVAAGLSLTGAPRSESGGTRSRGAARGAPLGRGQGPAHRRRLGPLRRPAAAALHRPGDRGQPRGPADGRALLGARPGRHAGDRGADRRAERWVHDRDRHPQHAAGGAGRRHHRFFNSTNREAGAAGGDRRRPTRSSPNRMKATEDVRRSGEVRLGSGRCRDTEPNIRSELERLEASALGGARPGQRGA